MEWREAAVWQKEVQAKLAACLQRWRLNLLSAAFDAFLANLLKLRKAKMVRSRATYGHNFWLGLGFAVPNTQISVHKSARMYLYAKAWCVLCSCSMIAAQAVPMVA